MELTAKQKKDRTVYGCKSQLVAAVKDVDLTKRVVTGFYNSVNYFDSDWDVSLPGSYNKTISDRGPESNAVAKFKMLRDHNWEKALSRPMVLEERAVNIDGFGSVSGLYFEAKLSKSTAGNDALIDYQEEVIDNHSFGFAYGDLRWLSSDTEEYKRVFDSLLNPEDAEGKGGLYAVAEYIGFEGSAVPFGANDLTPYFGVKTGDRKALTEKLAEKVAAMRRSVKSGKQSDDHLERMVMELRQIEQLIKGLEVEQPLKEDTQNAPPSTDEPTSRRKLLFNI